MFGSLSTSLKSVSRLTGCDDRQRAAATITSPNMLPGLDPASFNTTTHCCLVYVCVNHAQLRSSFWICDLGDEEVVYTKRQQQQQRT